MRKDYEDIEDITSEFFDEKLPVLLKELRRIYEKAEIWERGGLDVTTSHDSWVIAEMIEDTFFVCEWKILQFLNEKNKNGKITKID